MLLTETVETKWNPSTKKWFLSKGYIFTGIGTPVTVKTKDLKPTSLARIKVSCDICGEIVDTCYGYYNNKRYVDGKDYCKHCKRIKGNKTLMKNYGTTDILSIGNNRKNCLEKHRNSYEYVKSEFDKLGYILLTKEYNNCNQKLRYICPVHGEQVITFRSITHGCRCSKCRSSKSEALIDDILKKNNVIYATQYSFPDLKTTRLLRFDFCIFNDDGKTIKLLLEYQGEQHYRPADFAGKGEEWSKESLKNCKRLDRLKRLYCKSHGIPLVAIKYTQKNNLESIISNLLKLRW